VRLVRREKEDTHTFVRDQRPSLLILDIRIGGEERGWTILNLLTLDPDTRPIPVIVCSAAIQSLHEHQDLLSKYGIYALPKPFDVEALLETVARMLPEE
jgi:CheY-like chemotaxis protein